MAFKLITALLVDVNRRLKELLPGIAAIPCPVNPAPWSMEFIEEHAYQCLKAVGLAELGWCFSWDRAKRRVGCCHYRSGRISLSVHFAEHFRYTQPEQLHRTLLHELAHALAYLVYGESSHGVHWRQCCCLLGIPHERVCLKCAAADSPPGVTAAYRYAVCHAETGEVFRRYWRRPRITSEKLAQSYIRGRRSETLGKLRLFKLD